MSKAAKKPTPKRQATEQRIIDAFEKVLRRDGAENMGVNAIVKEAGVGKGLLYDYFGGLEGLAQAWVKNTDFVPSMEEIVGEPLDTFREKSAVDCIGQIHVNYATMLKKDKLAGQLMAEELLRKSALSKPMQTIRHHIGKSHEAFFMQDEKFMDPDAMALIFVLQAASNYLALRAQHAPVYNGIDISTEDGWDMMMQMVKRVADLGPADPESR
jgi:AcrR family transcriptional regulator